MFKNIIIDGFSEYFMNLQKGKFDYVEKRKKPTCPRWWIGWLVINCSIKLY